jgi:hypothetical protein
MKAYRRCGGIALRILNLGTRWRSVDSLTSRPLYPYKKSPQNSLDKLGGPQKRSGLFQEKFLARAEIRTAYRPTHSLVNILTMLFRLPSWDFVRYAHRTQYLSMKHGVTHHTATRCTYFPSVIDSPLILQPLSDDVAPLTLGWRANSVEAKDKSYLATTVLK